MKVAMRCISVAVGALTLAACSGSGSGGGSGADWQPTFVDTPFPAVTASKDPAVIAQGEYLVNSVAHCTACHLPQGTLASLSPEEVRKALPQGGREWSMGPDFTIRSPNITPHPTGGVGNWTDAELGRAIKYAIDREGHAMYLMNGLGYIADEDVTAIVSYLRSIRGVSQSPPRTEVKPAGQEMIRKDLPGYLLPRPQTPVEYVAAGAVSAARGNYLVNGPARCVHCHSDVQAAPKVYSRGPLLSGSLWPEPDPGDATMEINAPNLTPSTKYGAITSWTEDNFVQRFRAGRVIAGSEMPWENFQQLTEEDLRSIYRYLHALKPEDVNPGPSYREKGWKPQP